MDIPNIQGLDHLYQAITEALEIEKCSICLERLENTVLLWPCTHWFCNKCILTLHKSAKGEKVTCPLCKSATSRRKVLPFRDKQVEYEDYLQTLIGALSLDLKFDVTSYRNIRKHENATITEHMDTIKVPEASSPLKKTRRRTSVRVVEVKPDIQQNQKRPTRKSGKLQSKNNNSFTVNGNKIQSIVTPKPIPALLPETPDDSPKQKKVKEWLDSNKFSQADQDICVETVVADVHNVEQDESLCFSETALQSVSQVDHKSMQTPIRRLPTKTPIDTPPDVNAIKMFNRTCENGKLCKNLKASVPMPAVEQFDQVFPENRKLQTVTTTYGSKNPYTSTGRRGQRFAVQVDLFKSIDENNRGLEKPSPVINSGSSEETLEDFSSGSGEEWAIVRKPRKCNLVGKVKTLKNNRQQPKRNKNLINKCESAVTTRDGSKMQKDVPNLNNCNKIKSFVKCFAADERIKPKEDLVKDIIDDWNDTKDSNNLHLDQSQTSARQNEKILVSRSKNENVETKSKNNVPEIKKHKIPDSGVNQVVNTPHKEINNRSPGWSRLKSTKKEFHLSEKKKLNLKTLNKTVSNSSLSNIGVSPLFIQGNSSINNLNKTDCDQPKVESVKNVSMEKPINSSKTDTSSGNLKDLDIDVHCQTNNKKTPELSKNLNTSLISSTSGSPFRGFVTPEEKECSKKLLPDVDKTEITPKKTITHFAVNFSQKKSDKITIIQNKDIETHPSDYGLKETLMEVDMPYEDPKASDRSLEKLHSFRGSNNISNALQEGCPVSSKKRDRDSGIHNESGISSPIRKKVCRDAEVQTSPGRMQSVIRDMLKDMCGLEWEEMMKQSNKTDLRQNVTSPHHSYTTLSQGSDKENVNVSSKNRDYFKKSFDDSEVVSGTEDSRAVIQMNSLFNGFYKKQDLTDKSLNHHILKGNIVIDYNDVDPDAPTQLYKTPVVPKRQLQTSTKQCTVVSNPRTSELKRLDTLFDKSDVLFPDDTPKGMTPWNYSGVDQLGEHTSTSKKSVDRNAITHSSQTSKEKANKSRRQLEFVEENSNDIFDFEGQTSCQLKDDFAKDELVILQFSNGMEIVHDKVDKLGDIFTAANELLDEEDASTANTNLLRTNNQELNPGNECESTTLSDTPGIVGPSEEQGFQTRMNLAVPKNQNGNADYSKNMLDKPVMCFSTMNAIRAETMNQNTHLHKSRNQGVEDPSDLRDKNFIMTKKSSPEQNETSINCINTREDDEVSNPPSEISFVEGTPDVSHIEDNQQAVLNNDKSKETVGQAEKTAVEILGVQSSKETTKHAISSFHSCHKDISQSVQEELRHTKEKMIDDSASNNMMENTERDDDNLCFASSLLNPQQNQVLACVLGGMGLTYSKTVGPHISHLIVGTKNGCFQNTYKVLLAMALHKPIIRFDWVEEVIRTGGTVPLDPFIALDPSGECGVLRAKADKNRELLCNFAIHIHNVNDRIVMKEQIEELVRHCGGIVVKNLNDFYNIPRDKFRIIILSEPPDSLTQGDWRQKYLAAEVMIDWIYNTIGRYRVMPLIPFMVTDAADAVPFLQQEGYPKELIFDLTTQE